MAKEKEVQEGTNEAANITQEYFEAKGAKSASNRAVGGNDVEVSLVDNIQVRFTKDFGKHLKKGAVMTISQVAYEIYESKGVVEKVN